MTVSLKHDENENEDEYRRGGDPPPARLPY